MVLLKIWINLLYIFYEKSFFIKNVKVHGIAKKVKIFAFFLLTIVKMHDIINKNKYKKILFISYGTAQAGMLVDIFCSWIHKILVKKFDFGMTYEFSIHKFVFCDN